MTSLTARPATVANGHRAEIDSPRDNDIYQTKDVLSGPHKRPVINDKEINAMAMEAYEIESMIKEALPDAQVRIEDLRGDGDHYAAIVISEAFRGKTRVMQHQMVYSALKGKMGGDLHALALQTSAPD